MGQYGNHSYNGYGNKSGGGYSQPQVSSFTLDGFYKDGKLNPDLFDSKAKEIAKSFTDGDNGVTSTQLRRIFDEVKRFEQILTISNNQWDKQLPYIKMIKSKVAYSVARAINKNYKDKEVYKNLEKFIIKSIDLIQKEEDYHIFVSLFESVYGFYYDLAPKKCK
jgi:CRISPR-associated protein Csm2